MFFSKKPKEPKKPRHKTNKEKRIGEWFFLLVWLFILGLLIATAFQSIDDSELVEETNFSENPEGFWVCTSITIIAIILGIHQLLENYRKGDEFTKEWFKYEEDLKSYQEKVVEYNNKMIETAKKESQKSPTEADEVENTCNKCGRKWYYSSSELHSLQGSVKGKNLSSKLTYASDHVENVTSLTFLLNPLSRKVSERRREYDENYQRETMMITDMQDKIDSYTKCPNCGSRDFLQGSSSTKKSKTPAKKSKYYEYKKLTIPVLKEKLKNHGESLAGTKRQLIQRLIKVEKAKTNVKVSTPESAKNSVEVSTKSSDKKSRLKEVKGLFEEGLIDEAEFKLEKKKILDE